MDEKTCRECGEVKPLTDYHVNRAARDGRQFRCKSCCVAKARARREEIREDPERFADHVARRRANDRKYGAERRKDPAYREWMSEYQKRWRVENRERISAYAAAWRRSNPKAYEATRRRYFESHPDASRESAAKRRAWKRDAFVEEVRAEVLLELYGTSCYLCETQIYQPRDMHMDHVVPLSRGGEHSVANVRPTHKACNLRKSDRLLSELDLPFN